MRWILFKKSQQRVSRSLLKYTMAEHDKPQRRQRQREKLLLLPAAFMQEKREWWNDHYRRGRIIIKGACHLWRYTQQYRKQPKGSYGYGAVNFNPLITGHFSVGAHVFSVFLSTGRVASDGEDVSHLCHRKDCVNPAHLVIEPHLVNCESRDACSPYKICQGHIGRPDCIFN